MYGFESIVYGFESVVYEFESVVYEFESIVYEFESIVSILQIGSSLFDEEGSHIVSKLMTKADSKGVKIVFPVDFITADKFDKDANVSLIGLAITIIISLCVI